MSDLAKLSTVARAAALQERGLRVFPVDHPAHLDCIGSGCRREMAEARAADADLDKLKCPPGTHRKRGKHPIGGWVTLAASPMTERFMLMQFADREDGPVNIGIACKASGVLVLDEDMIGQIEKLADERGQVIDCNYRLQTGKGVHYWFGPPECGTPIGNRSGALGAMHIDVRGGVASSNNGGYVLAPGSAHVSGKVYAELDVWPGKENLRPFPAWLVPDVQAKASPSATTGLNMDGAASAGNGSAPSGTVFAPYGTDGWTDDVRYGTQAELVLQFERHVLQARECRRADGTVDGARWRTEGLYLAALDGWRLVDIGARKEEVERRLLQLIADVWEAGPDGGDLAVVAEAKAKAKVSPWELIVHPSSDPHVGLSNNVRETVTGSEGSSSAGASDGEDISTEPPPPITLGEAPSAEELETRTFAEEVRKAKLRKRATREAERQIAAEQRSGQPSIADELIDVTALAQVKQSPALMAKLLPGRQIGFLYGPFGTYKSYAATEMVIAAALGRPFLGDPQFAVPEPVASLYVAAEGAPGIAQRILTWQEVHEELIPAGQLAVYPKPLRLNDEAVVAELAALIEDRGFRFVVVDTYHRSAPGTEENSSTEFGMVFEAMAELRDRLGITVLFVDHSGRSGTIRGTSAKETDGDFLLHMTVEDDGQLLRGIDVQRTLRVIKHKDWPSEGEWNVRLVQTAHPVEQMTTVFGGDSVPLGPPPAYLELGDVIKHNADGSTFESDTSPEKWWLAELDWPAAAQRLAQSGAGRKAVLDTYRVLSWMDDEHGVTRAMVVDIIHRSKAQRGGLTHSKENIRVAITRLIEAGVVESLTTERVRLIKEGR